MYVTANFKSDLADTHLDYANQFLKKKNPVLQTICTIRAHGRELRAKLLRAWVA